MKQQMIAVPETAQEIDEIMERFIREAENFRTLCRAKKVYDSKKAIKIIMDVIAMIALYPNNDYDVMMAKIDAFNCTASVLTIITLFGDKINE